MQISWVGERLESLIVERPLIFHAAVSKKVKNGRESQEKSQDRQSRES